MTCFDRAVVCTRLFNIETENAERTAWRGIQYMWYPILTGMRKGGARMMRFG